MKSIFATLFFLTLGFTASANHEVKKDMKVPVTPKTIVIYKNYKTSSAIIYLDKHSKIKKALNFESKAQKAKLA